MLSNTYVLYIYKILNLSHFADDFLIIGLKNN